MRANRPLAVLATVAMIFLLHYAAEFFIPLFISLWIAYALARPVTWLEAVVRWRSLAAAIVVLAIVGLAGVAAWAWSDDAQNIYEQLPDAAKTISKSLQKYVKPGGPITEVKKSAVELENVAQTGKAAPAPAAQPQPPQQNSASQITLWQVLGTGAKGLSTATADVMVVLFLVFFMLASGDLFKKKVLAIAAERNKKRFTAQVLDDVDEQIRSYLLVMLVANALVGLGTGLAFWALGVKYAPLWGVVAAILHTAPYFGPAIVAAGSLVAAFVQFGSWTHAFAVSGASIAIATVVGMLFATWLASRQTRMNTTATFIGLLFFGWLWGFWGILLAIPILSVAKVVCEANEDWKPVAELLGR
ncbi:MAG TPA: AI-2E family transporter [Usitatibacter sp.]|nr:AI-2E family transporter [Usitatibacter sp.]